MLDLLFSDRLEYSWELPVLGYCAIPGWNFPVISYSHTHAVAEWAGGFNSFHQPRMAQESS